MFGQVRVDPGNPDIVYLVSEGANPPSGDLLYRSSDGAMTWTMVLATTQPIRDRIVIIEEGRVTGDDHHRALLEHHPMYASLLSAHRLTPT